MPQFSNPIQILEAISISPGSVVVDLGSGSGHYAMAAARMVGHEGKVYAVDIQKDLLERLREAAHNEKQTHLEIIWGDVEQYGGTKLRERTADVVLLCNILFQLPDKRGAIQEAKRILRPNGRIVVVDWTGSHFGLGPDPELVVTKDEAMRVCEEQHLNLDREFDAGDHHYGLVYRVSSSGA